jgi:GNAT superfamily N-acetyltransferase
MDVREATAADWPAVSALLAELGRPDVRGLSDEDVHRRRFEDYLAREDALALVAVDDGQIVGFIDVEFRQRLNFREPQAWVPDLIVTEDARSRGAGKALLAETLARSGQRGCWSLALESANWRERAHAFYVREGLMDTAHAFTKLLVDIEWPPVPR